MTTPASLRQPEHEQADALASEVARCRTVTSDQAAAFEICRRVWAENRRQFFGSTKNAAQHLPTRFQLRPVPTREEQDRISPVEPEHQPSEVDDGWHRRHRPFPRGLHPLHRFGFGLLSGEVAFLATTLAAIDITLAAIFWSWAADEDIIARLSKKTLFVGVFAYLIGNWNNLARIVFESFSGLGSRRPVRAYPLLISSSLVVWRRSGSMLVARSWTRSPG